MAKQTPNKKVTKKQNRNIFKEMWSELKKVSFPTLPKTIQQTGVVISVVLLFTLVLFGVDRLFSWLFGLLI